VLRDPDGYNNGGTTHWENGWLPALFRGTEIQSRGAAVLNLHPAVAAPEGVQRNTLELLARLNEAITVQDMALLGYRLHPLKGNRAGRHQRQCPPNAHGRVKMGRDQSESIG
ncbi:MAG: DUF1501 domain-containing protein, partial [Nitrospirae bacterium]|nr:DUF1501 domain-containing protein [Nitrospirota bacterium]